MSDLSAEVGGRKVGFQTGPRGILDGRPSLVLVHGAGGSRFSWRALLPVLDAEINVAALELPGHGETTGPRLSSIAEHAGFTAEVLQTWKLPAPVVVAGHSMGSAVALELGLTHPEHIQALILLGAGAVMPVNQALFEGLRRDFAGTEAMIVKWAMAKSAPQRLRDEVLELMLKNEPETIISDFQACDGFDRRSGLEEISYPVLIVCGREDKMTPPSFSEYLRQNIPGSRLEMIDQAGHLLMDEKPDQVKAIILEFIKGLK